MNEQTSFEISPLQGAGGLRFGMSPPQVAQLLGPADKISKNHLGQRVEFRSFMNVAYSVADPLRLEHFGFGRQMEGLTMGGVALFQVPELQALRALNRLDDQPRLYLGFVVFLKLGMALTGFHDNDLAQKAITLFPEGTWDKRVERMLPFSLPRLGREA